MRWNKRGQEDKLYFIIYEWIVLAMVVIIILVAVRGVVNSSSYWKKYYSADMANIADLENTNQGDFVINYQLKENVNYLKGILNVVPGVGSPTTKRTFEIELKSDHFGVYDAPKEQSLYPTTFPFAKARTITVKEGSVISDFITISKIGNDFSLGTTAAPTSDICTQAKALDTKDDINKFGFHVLSVNSQTDNLAKSLSILYKDYGKNYFVNESRIVFVNTTENMIYYSDTKILKSTKFACLAREAISNRMMVDFKLQKYDGFLDNENDFRDFTMQSQEYYIVIGVFDPNLLSGNPAIDFANAIDNSTREYFK